MKVAYYESIPRVDPVKISRSSPAFFKNEWFKKPVITRDVSGTAVTVCETKELFGTFYVTSIRTENISAWDIGGAGANKDIRQ